MLQPTTQNHVHVTARTHGLHTIELRARQVSHSGTLSAREIMDVSLERPVYDLFNNFSSRQIRLPKRMTVAQSGTIPDVIHAGAFNDQKIFPKGTLEVDNDRSSPSAKPHSNVPAVHCKRTEKR